ncbi:peptidoglycan/LPS O-acetylase OafA/YrhL [Dysgonomonas sp. PH5-45]|uniref:acyltransferase family protein n=1 Tax=unclassified Dysgonomonas TaxID=2630389 RepID=UPI0024731DCA|nr:MULTISPECIES: acyltransferase [unclassified Dysgonomonas]MDH6354436.1 peptidoglycan/LPS O-acetylase OafA/YrhL [Dysgonomonas sp. PH5-45]MDH6387335.1 peptidoglycan/LPS O-acetylase OafA/YrhL [Dysgonomonas sp. PH5-37]
MVKPLTSLRFFFALMVLLSHCSSERVAPFFDKHIFQEGYAGVGFFFILSGFIIAYSYRERILEGEVSREEFWVARIARIYPLHILTLLMVIFAGLVPFKSAISWITHFVPNLFLIQSFIPVNHFYYSFNSPSWSLGCEQLFYLLFPFLISWLNDSKKLLLILIPLIIVALTGMYFTPDEETITNSIWYVNPITRLPDFLIGLFLFHIYDKYKNINISYTKASLLEISSIVLLLAFYLLSGYFSIVYRASIYYWIPISLTILIFAFRQGVISKILSNQYLVRLGEVSFGIYMFHFIIIILFNKIINETNVSLPFYISFFIIIFIVLSVSFLSYHYFEKPIAHLIKSYPKNGKQIPQ